MKIISDKKLIKITIKDNKEKLVNLKNLSKDIIIKINPQTKKRSKKPKRCLFYT